MLNIILTQQHNCFDNMTFKINCVEENIKIIDRAKRWDIII